MLVASAGPKPVAGRSAFSSETHVQDVMCAHEALNIFDIVVLVLISPQPPDSGEAVSSAPHRKAFWRGAAGFSGAEALTLNRLVPPRRGVSD